MDFWELNCHQVCSVVSLSQGHPDVSLAGLEPKATIEVNRAVRPCTPTLCMGHHTCTFYIFFVCVSSRFLQFKINKTLFNEHTHKYGCFLPYILELTWKSIYFLNIILSCYFGKGAIYFQSSKLI